MDESNTIKPVEKQLNNLSKPRIIKLGGDTNINLKLGNTLIKKIVHGDAEFIDDAYSQLLEKKLFGITHYQRFEDLVFLPYIEGEVSHELEIKEILNLSNEINSSGLRPKISILDVFSKYNFTPDEITYSDLLDSIGQISHGDMAYTNIVKTPHKLVPIDWEFLCYSVKYWDLACFLASLYIYNHSDCENILSKTTETKNQILAIKAVMLLCDYWIAWSITTNYDFFSKELKDLRKYLSQTI